MYIQKDPHTELISEFHVGVQAYYAILYRFNFLSQIHMHSRISSKSTLL